MHKQAFIQSLTLGILLLLLPTLTIAQKKIGWETLSTVRYDYSYDDQYGMWHGDPSFSEELKKLEGKEIIISGYVIPLDTEGLEYVLSAQPYSACFFCGKAGKETVMEIFLKKNKARYKMDQRVTFKGKFRLNPGIYGLSFALEEAVEM